MPAAGFIRHEVKMPLITERSRVLEVYAAAAARKWVVPTFCSENLTTTEAILAAVSEFGAARGLDFLPVAIAITNLYDHRSQTLNYTRTGAWRMGLKLFAADLKVLCGPDSPFAGLQVMLHLDHIKPEFDGELLGQGDFGEFSSIMFDASAASFARNIAQTAEFMQKHGQEIVVEGACDEIVDAGGAPGGLTTPERAEIYLRGTQVDFMVANLGTEHRASAADLRYHGELARAISARVGPRLVLHGCSSVSDDQIGNLFDDGVRKVNIWTALERDSSPALLAAMAANAARVAGPAAAQRLRAQDLLGARADLRSPPDLKYFTTVWRQEIVFREMKKIVGNFLGLFYR